MKHRVLKTLSVFIAICLLFQPIILAWGEDLSSIEDELMKDKLLQVLVKYKDGEGIEAKSFISKSFSKVMGQVDSIGPDIDVITLNDADIMDDVIEELKKEDRVELVEKNQVSKLFNYPNDNHFYKQWWFNALNVEGAWALASTQQKGIVVAVIDSGIDSSHPDLVNRIAPGGYDFYNNTPNVYDINGHGTEVAGVLAAEVDNFQGIAGICGKLDVKVLPLRVSNYAGYSLNSDIIEALDYAINYGVDVINLSLGSDIPSEIYNTVIQRAINAGIIVVAAAGNDGDNLNPIFYPASYPNVISVGSTDKNNMRSDFSNYNEFVDIVAPGESIYSTSPNNNYNYFQGTSFSAPMVSGVFAMMKAINPEISIDEAKEVVLNTATDLGDIGYDVYYGHGLLNAYRSLRELTHEEPILTTGIRLDKSDIRMQLPQARNILFSDSILESTGFMSDGLPSIYESESNDAPYSSNGIYCDYNIFGTITDRYDDVDCYKLEVKDYGELKIFGQWVGDNVGNRGLEDDLTLALIDSQSKLIDISRYEDFYDGTGATTLEAHINPGTYYICVYQSSGYVDLYVNEPYVFNCSFQEGIKVDNVLLNKSVLVLKRNTLESLIPEISPKDATNQNLFWSTDNPEVIGLDQNGRVKGKSVGIGEVTVTAEDGDKKASCIVVVTDETKFITLSMDRTCKFMKKDEVFRLNLTQKSWDGISYPVLWCSNNRNVATVDKSGIVTAVGRGKAVISAVVEDKYVQMVVKVTDDRVNTAEALFETVLPQDAWYKNVLWQSSNSGVAYVDESGIITARGSGVAYITATTSDRAYSSNCKVTVERTNPNWSDRVGMEVSKDKVFEILFNAPLDKRTLNKDTLYLARDVHGVDRITGYLCEINKDNPCIVNVRPSGLWSEGEYYLFITDKIVGRDGREHKKNIRMKFTVK